MSRKLLLNTKRPRFSIKELAILIVVNQLFERGMNDDELYEITRGNWIIGERRDEAKFAFSVYNGVVRQVYEIQKWFPVTVRRQGQKTQQRWRFDGTISQDLQHYVGGSVENYVAHGAQNPINMLTVEQCD